MNGEAPLHITLLAIIAVAVFTILWFISLILTLGGTIIATFLLRNNPSINLEMGWIAVMLIIPPIFAFLISVPATIFFMKKINRKMKAKKQRIRICLD